MPDQNNPIYRLMDRLASGRISPQERQKLIGLAGGIAQRATPVVNLYPPDYLTTPLTSTDWDGDARSTTAKTELDLYTVFGAPKNIRAVYVYTKINDSGSLAGNALLILSPVATANVGPYISKATGFTDDYIKHDVGWIPCNENGNIYYQIAASGAGLMDVWLEIWGYQRR